MVRWRVHGEREIYSSPWVNLALTTVEPPGLEPFEHHVVRMPGPAAGCIVTRPADHNDGQQQADAAGDDEVLLLYRHRFITDSWGWELPAGGVDAGESPAEAAARETLEETGWRLTGDPAPIIRFYPSNGLSDQAFHIFRAVGAEEVGPPSDPTEASRVEWRTVRDVRALIANGEITDGLSLTGLCAAFTLGVLR